jgi:hypothetical protein
MENLNSSSLSFETPKLCCISVPKVSNSPNAFPLPSLIKSNEPFSELPALSAIFPRLLSLKSQLKVSFIAL